MLTYELSAKSPYSLYEQLYRAIRSDIETAHLDAGSKLPSKRTLAQHLGISVITVESAYRQLAAEGYIEAKERRGYFVNELPSARMHVMNADSERSAHLPNAGATTKQIEMALSSAPSIRATPLLADFSGNDRSGDQFPFHIWARTVRRTLSEASKGLLLRTAHDNRGSEELRVAIAQHLASFRGLEASPEQIIIGAGAQDLYGVLVQLLGREHTFAVEDPGYPALRTHYELSGAHVIGIPVDERGLDVVLLGSSGASIAHCSPAHQFPTGSVMSAVRRHELLDWARKVDEEDALQSSDGQDTEENLLKRYIIEDDYDSEFRMRGRPIRPLFMQDDHESVIYMNTFTRSLGSAFRIAYMVLPLHLLATFNERFAVRACMVGALEQLELARFITSGDYERHVNRQRSAYRRLQDALVSKLAASDAGRYLSFKGVGSGLHFLMEIESEKRELLAERLEAKCLEQGIRLIPIDTYRSLSPSSATTTEEDPAADLAKLDEMKLVRPHAAVETGPSTTEASCANSAATYVMNVSSLDSARIDQIAATLSDTIISQLRNL